MQQADIAVVGLGTMGAALARNLRSRGFVVAVFNRTVAKMEKFVAEFGEEGFVGCKNLEELTANLKAPRKVIVLVPDQAVDEVLDELTEILQTGDMIMDGGNTYFKTTTERQVLLAKKGIGLLGCGISGGEEGALHGPSLMPGGDKVVYEAFAPFLEAVAAKDFAGGETVSFMGHGAAGHYVKMVHNGMEYAEMQILVEAYLLLKNVCGLSNPQMRDVFASYNKGRNSAFLLDLIEDVLVKEDDQPGETGYLIDKILDTAGQKGTGRWTAMEALELGVPLGTIMEAVNSRNLSARHDLRAVLASAGLPRLENQNKIAVEEFIENLEATMFGVKLVVYAQGYELLKVADKNYGFGLNLAEIARVWQGGCIIRARVLELLEQTWKKDQNKHLLEFKEIQQELSPTFKAIQIVLAEALQSGVFVPVTSSAFNYTCGAFNEDSGANLTQALRDYFGAHTYMRKDREGVFHTKWN